MRCDRFSRQFIFLIASTSVVFGLAGASMAEEIKFRRHVLNPDSEFCSCLAMDVNRDGELDIICGGYWYEGPTWKRHFLRQVRMIGNRYDDYSHLPMDVNADGWTDYISVNYRSGTLYWVEHPGSALGVWKKHLIGAPGKSETGRLEDVDGDGRIDVLPNGMDWSGWYELVHAADSGGKTVPRWIQHDLPTELTGHGTGFGDINGDGRSDVVGTRGWAEAPEDRRKGEWIWHGEFRLSRGASIPMPVYDVDGDGDNDIVWGDGHDYGVYWLEQTQDAEGKRKWIQHTIDESWSQAHSVLMADIDGDGQDDLVAGKRYWGHDGRDPGGTDPMCIYWYNFDRSSKLWHRHTISEGHRVGFDLDPKAVDIDGDGDLDIIAPARSGLHLMENLRIDTAGTQN